MKPIAEKGGITHPEPHKSQAQVKAIADTTAKNMGHPGSKC